MATKTKSVHLYGRPNLNKYQELKEIETLYRQQINFFIAKLIDDKKYYLDIFNNNNQAPKVRQLEKDNRTKLGSAYGQNAVDTALTHLHNHFIKIRNDLYSHFVKDKSIYLVQSLGLLNACITDEDIFDTLDQIIENAATNEKEEFYKESKEVLSQIEDLKLEAMIKEIKFSFLEELKARKTPTIKNTTIQLDSRLCTIEKAKNIETHFVLSVKSLTRGKRIEVPLMTSSNSLRRLEQYKYSKSVKLKLVEDKVKISIPFKKKVKQRTYKSNVVGIDVGITDLIYTSSGDSFGSYSEMQKMYNNTVEKKVANRRNLANKMRQYQKELKNPLTSKKQKEYLKEKIYNISRMLQGKKKLDKLRRAYNHKRDYEIAQAIKDVVNKYKGKKVTIVLEDLEIIKFDKKNRKTNQKFSMWIRGRLLKKLMEELDWNGISYKQVDPAFTSQICPNCNKLHADNRDGKAFICNVCGFEGDADYVASINIKNRAFDVEVNEIVEKYKYATKKRHKELRKLYNQRHIKYLKEHIKQKEKNPA